MAYSWTTVTQYVTTVLAAHISQLHTNIDSERTARGLAAYSWTQTPTQYSDFITAAGFNQMQTALDQAHSQNYCVVDYVHCVNHYPSYNATYYQCTTNLYTYYYTVYESNVEGTCGNVCAGAHYHTYCSTF